MNNTGIVIAALIVLAILVMINGFVVMVSYQWCADHVFNGAVEAGLIADSLTYDESIVLAIILIALFTSPGWATRRR